MVLDEAPATEKAPTLVIDKVKEAEPEKDAPVEVNFSVPVNDLKHATLSDLSDSLKNMAEEGASIDNTIILK